MWLCVFVLKDDLGKGIRECSAFESRQRRLHYLLCMCRRAGQILTAVKSSDEHQTRKLHLFYVVLSASICIFFVCFTLSSARLKINR